MFAWRSHAYRGGHPNHEKPLQIKPSDGLEPSTPSLPFRFRGGNRGNARVTAATKVQETWTGPDEEM